MPGLKEISEKDQPMFPMLQEKLNIIMPMFRQYWAEIESQKPTESEIPINDCDSLMTDLEKLTTANLNDSVQEDYFPFYWNRMIENINKLTGYGYGVLPPEGTLSQKTHDFFGAGDYAEVSEGKVCNSLLSFASATNQLRNTVCNLNREIDAFHAANWAVEDETLDQELQDFFTALNENPEMAVDLADYAKTEQQLQKELYEISGNLRKSDSELDQLLKSIHADELVEQVEKAEKDARSAMEQENANKLENYKNQLETEYKQKQEEIAANNIQITAENKQIIHDNEELDRQIQEIEKKLEQELPTVDVELDAQRRNADEELQQKLKDAEAERDAALKQEAENFPSYLEKDISDYQAELDAETRKANHLKGVIDQMEVHKTYAEQMSKFTVEDMNDKDQYEAYAADLRQAFGTICMDNNVQSITEMKGLNNLLKNSIPQGKEKTKTEQLLDTYQTYQNLKEKDMKASITHWDRNVKPLMTAMDVTEADVEAYLPLNAIFKADKAGKIRSELNARIASNSEKSVADMKTPSAHLESVCDFYESEISRIRGKYPVYFNTSLQPIKDSEGKTYQYTPEELNDMKQEEADLRKNISTLSGRVQQYTEKLKSSTRQRKENEAKAERRLADQKRQLPADTEAKKKQLAEEAEAKRNSLRSDAEKQKKELKSRKRKLKAQLNTADHSKMVERALKARQQTLKENTDDYVFAQGMNKTSELMGKYREQFSADMPAKQVQLRIRLENLTNNSRKLQQLHERTTTRQNSRNQAVTAIKNVSNSVSPLPDSMKLGIDDALRQIDKGRRLLHRDSAEFSAMRKGLTELQQILSNGGQPDLKNLKERMTALRTAAGTYITAKNTELHIGKDSSMRTLRLRFAEDLVKFADNCATELGNLDAINTGMAQKQNELTGASCRLDVEKPADFLFSGLNTFVPEGKESAVKNILSSLGKSEKKGPEAATEKKTLQNPAIQSTVKKGDKVKQTSGIGKGN